MINNFSSLCESMISQQLDKYRLDRYEILFTIPKLRRSKKIKQHINHQTINKCTTPSLMKCCDDDERIIKKYEKY